MTSGSNAPQHRDPLRKARHAVKDGRFRDAVSELGTIRSAQIVTPEWYLLMAMAQWRLGQFRESQSSAHEALMGFRSRGDSDGEMRAENVAAAGDFALGQLVSARTGFARALVLARALNDQLMKARCANNLGNVAYYSGDLLDALRWYQHGVHQFERVGSLRGIAESSHNLAVVYREKGDLTAARNAADRAFEAAERLADPRVIGWSLAGLGETDALGGDTRLAREHMRRALVLARETSDRPAEIEAGRILAMIARTEGRIGEALDFVRPATRLAVELQHRWLTAKTHEELGECLLLERSSDEALRALETAAGAFDALGSRDRSAPLRARIEHLRTTLS